MSSRDPFGFGGVGPSPYGPPMNYPVPSSPYDPPLNPMPGSYNARQHGHPLLFQLIRLTKALGSGDSENATLHANELQEVAMRHGATQDTINELHAALKDTLKLQLPRDAGTGALADIIKGSDSIDRYEPDPNFFYVRDKKSGAELEAVLEDLRYMERYIKRGARAPSRLLFIGDPGNGKTMGARWLGSKLNKVVALVRIDGTIGSMVGETSKRLRAACEQAVEEDALIVIDEFEAIAVSRAKTGPNVGQWHKETTSALLQLLDSLPPKQILIGATNVPGEIDKAVLRRLRKHVFFHPPDRDARAAMLSSWWKTAPHEPEAKRVLLDMTEGQSGDFLERASEEANRTAARRSETSKITIRDIELAVLATAAVSIAIETSTAVDQPLGPPVATSSTPVPNDTPPDAPSNAPTEIR